MTQPIQKIREAHEQALVGRFTAPSGAHVEVSSKIHPEGWQVAAWRLWKAVGELHAPTTYIARVISRRIDWRVSRESGLVESNAGAALIQRALGDMPLDEFVRLLVLNLQVAGDMWVIRTPNVGDAHAWGVFSVTQDRLKEMIEDAQRDGRSFRRVYDPDPVQQGLADSAMSGVIEPAEDLLTLSALSRAQSRSRIAMSGLLLVPQEQSFEGGDPFGADLEQAMTTSIADVHSAAAVAPIKVEMASDLIEKVRHVTFERSFDEQVPEKMEKAIRRIALGLDVPPELLLGVGDQNHWSAWVTQEETYRGTIAPLAEKVAGVLEYVVLTETGELVQIEPDPFQLMVRRPTPRDAIDSAKIGAVSLRYVRDAIGAGDEDAQPAEDTDLLIRIQTGAAGSSGDVQQSTSTTSSAPNGGIEP